MTRPLSPSARQIDWLPGAPLRAGRTHEVCGAGASGFAACLAGRIGGDVIWITRSWQAERINPLGYARFADPSKLLTVLTRAQDEALAVAEEALRAGAVPLVVVEVSDPLSLIAGRRLQLSAETGQSTALCLIPEGMGSNAAETRWRATPVFAADDSTLLKWEIIKNKAGTLTIWTVRWDDETRSLHVVSPVGERPGLARPPH